MDKRNPGKGAYPKRRSVVSIYATPNKMNTLSGARRATACQNSPSLIHHEPQPNSPISNFNLSKTMKHPVPFEATKPNQLTNKRTRPKARGTSKVKTGCQTCKIRRKKCDEKKPSCTPCLTTSRPCEFAKLPIPTPTPNPHTRPRTSLSPLESTYLDYFLQINIPESSLYFSPIWTTLLLQNMLLEPSLLHSVLAIGALSRTHYHPSPHSPSHNTMSDCRKFGLHHYNLAIRASQKLLDQRKWKILVLGSMLFINLEVFMGWGNRVQMLLAGARGILGTCGEGREDDEVVGILRGALGLIEGQFEGFRGFCI
ncbi:hypothetical protein HYFRA_00009378 [Hymenoscyphus fraxineus]|uniref:Zn(2)-C6 fungal-type domain-containing protein n=1 Tax=Hymenoscyphus fraxineus TaxID=746836 RepID=A0A9N9L540_9HELO|nr:hypothetical protein HYFRA_00009378 [Hymenoscyphus fraxineus]